MRIAYKKIAKIKKQHNNSMHIDPKLHFYNHQVNRINTRYNS
jgi:hypothetical protein